MEHTFTTEELKAINDSMMNYTVNVKYFGCKTTLKVHIGLKGNHLEIIKNLVAKEFGDKAEVLGAKITGKDWKPVSPF